MDFGFIERTRTPAPVFEGARNANIPAFATALRSYRLAALYRTLEA